MQRTGRINIPSYRIVVTEHTSGPQAGKYVELVGNYNPKNKDRNLKEDRIKYWMSVGAKPSGTVHNMLISAGIITGKKINVLPKKTVPAAAPVEAAEAPAAPAEAAAEPAAAEAPAVEEAPTETPSE